MSDWYYVQTKGRDEFRAKTNLARQGYETNLPLLDGAPLFPGYLFVEVDEKPFRDIEKTPGVMGLVRFDDYMPTVRSEILEKLHEAEWARSEDCKPGSEVIVNSGAFNHIRAIVKAKKHDRIIVFMKVLNQPQELEFPLKDVVAA